MSGKRNVSVYSGHELANALYSTRQIQNMIILRFPQYHKLTLSPRIYYGIFLGIEHPVNLCRPLIVQSDSLHLVSPLAPTNAQLTLSLGFPGDPMHSK